MDDLDDLVLIEDDDYMPSRPLLSRTASPTMRNTGRSSSTPENDAFDQDQDKELVDCIKSSTPEPLPIALPPTMEGFSPPPPPPSSESLASTPPNEDPITSSNGMLSDEPPPFSSLAKEMDEGDGISANDSMAGLQAAPKPRINPLSKTCNFPVPTYNLRTHNHVRRRRCAFNDSTSPPPPPPPPPPPAFWPMHEDGVRESATFEAPSPNPSVTDGLPTLPPVVGRPFGPQYVTCSFGRDRKRGPLPPNPLPPPPPPPPPFRCGSDLRHLPMPPPPPPPPPPSPPVVHSALDLSSPRYWSQIPIERTVQLPPRSNFGLLDPPSRTAVLLHHRASPFDLHHWLWLLKYGEPERWYARPAEAELARLRRFEAKGLGRDVADMVAQQLGCVADEREPATGARVVKLWVGDVMGVPSSSSSSSSSREHRISAAAAASRCFYSFAKEEEEEAAARRLEDEFLVYYSVVEAPERLEDDVDDDDFDDDELDDCSNRDGDNAHSGIPHRGARARAAAARRDEALAGGAKVYKVERTGNADACLARAWHNAAVNGWSTVFSCVGGGRVDLVQADGGLGVKGFERVGRLRELVYDVPCESGRTKIFY